MLQNLEPPKPQIQCKTCKILKSLEPSDSQILTAALADTSKWAAKTLSRELHNRGISLSNESITNHRMAGH